jgi:hypothetical protein
MGALLRSSGFTENRSALITPDRREADDLQHDRVKNAEALEKAERDLARVVGQLSPAWLAQTVRDQP